MCDHVFQLFYVVWKFTGIIGLNNSQNGKQQDQICRGILETINVYYLYSGQ